MGWKWAQSSRVAALQTQCSEFKPQSHPLPAKIWKWIVVKLHNYNIAKGETGGSCIQEAGD
jgi:hypothetical protein